MEAAVEAEEEWWQQQVTEMAEQDVEQWVQDLLGSHGSCAARGRLAGW